jgi:NAD(P)-dependent dehydrogenase (short-subunit alcohol dehydrogenase family)
VTNVSRIAWVVGVEASRGLGAASARRFAREGYKLAVTGRSPDALQLIVDEIVAAGGCAIAAPGDAQQEPGMVDILDRLESVGPVEVGVYNAGNAIWGPPLETKPADFEAMWRVGCSAASSSGARLPAACCHAATGLSSTPGPQQLFAEEPHLLHSPLLKEVSGWSASPLHANFEPRGIHVAHVIIDGSIEARHCLGRTCRLGRGGNNHVRAVLVDLIVGFPREVRHEDG